MQIIQYNISPMLVSDVLSYVYTCMIAVTEVMEPTHCVVLSRSYACVERDQTLISCYCSWHATCSQALSKLWTLDQSLLRKMINPQLDCCKPSSKWQKARWGLWNEASTDYPSQWIPTCWAFHLQSVQGYCTQNHGKMRLQSSSISKLV